MNLNLEQHSSEAKSQRFHASCFRGMHTPSLSLSRQVKCFTVRDTRHVVAFRRHFDWKNSETRRSQDAPIAASQQPITVLLSQQCNYDLSDIAVFILEKVLRQTQQRLYELHGFRYNTAIKSTSGANGRFPKPRTQHILKYV